MASALFPDGLARAVEEFHTLAGLRTWLQRKKSARNDRLMSAWGLGRVKTHLHERMDNDLRWFGSGLACC